MTKRKDFISRHFRPERASRETMAYLLDMSTDTFDRLVKQGHLPPAKVIVGIRRWHVDQVLQRWDGLEVRTQPTPSAPAAIVAASNDPYMPPAGPSKALDVHITKRRRNPTKSYSTI